MALKYTTTTMIKAALGDVLAAATSDADITAMGEQVEGLIDTELRIGTGGSSFTYSSLKAPHNLITLAATNGTAALVCATSTPSTSTIAEVSLMMENCLRWYNEAMMILREQGNRDFVVAQ